MKVKVKYEKDDENINEEGPEWIKYFDIISEPTKLHEKIDNFFGFATDVCT